MFWTDKKVLITGGSGFIGSFVVEKLVNHGAHVTIFDRVVNGTLESHPNLKEKISLIQGECSSLTEAIAACENQEIVMNLAAHVGGIDYNRHHQGTMLYDNLAIGSTMIEAARRSHVDRFLVVSSACVYPHDVVVPTPESEGDRGEPEETNGGYGWAKRIAEKLGKYYAEEFGMKVGIVRPYNVYGPRDHFDSESSHVIPAIIKRIFDGENPLKVWGSGMQSRAFLYVDDVAEGMINAIEKFPVPDPINLGTDEEITIEDLVNLIIKIAGKQMKVIFDTDKPDGSPRRNSDNTKAKEKIGFQPKIKLQEGLLQTVNWYKKNVL